MGNVSEIQQAKRWIRDTLLANPDIVSIVGQRIYADRANSPLVFPYIIFNFQGGTDRQAIGTSRLAVVPLFQIRVVTDSPPSDNVRIVDKRIDDALQPTRAVVSGDYQFSARREQPVDRPEVDTATNKTYYNLGGLYRIWIQGV